MAGAGAAAHAPSPGKQDRVGVEVESESHSAVATVDSPSELPAIIVELLDRSFQCILSVNRAQQIVCFNDAAEKTFGYRRDEVVGKPLGDLLPMPGRIHHDAVIDNIFEDLLCGETGQYHACIPCVRKDGTRFKASLVAEMTTAAAEPLLVAVIEDIVEKQRRMEELREVYALNQSLARRLLVQDELQRAAIARELHDEVGQLATSLGIELQMLRTQLEPRSDPSLERVDRMLQLVGNLHRAVRECVHELRPEVLDGATLHESIGSCAARLGLEQTGTRLLLDVDREVEGEMQSVTRVNLYRFVQEALTNIARHAAATEANVRIRRGLLSDHPAMKVMKCLPGTPNRMSDTIITLEIADNGRGFDPHAIRPSSVGLRNLRERVAAMGGVLRIESVPGVGSTLRAVIVESASA